jgi:hypothetical protein
MSRSYRASVFFTLCALFPCALSAAPFASNIVLSGGGTNVAFILNEDADTLTYSINGGAAVSLPATKGSHSFTIASGDVFSIQTSKNETGYALPTGGSVAPVANGLSVATNQSGFKLISDDLNVLNRFNSPRGVSVSNNPNAPSFGTAYIANSAAGSTTGVVRAVGDGMYAVHADQSDAFGYGNTAQDPGNKFDGVSASANSPFRVFTAANGEVYVSDFSDANGNVWRMNSTMTTDDQTLPRHVHTRRGHDNICRNRGRVDDG